MVSSPLKQNQNKKENTNKTNKKESSNETVGTIDDAFVAQMRRSPDQIVPKKGRTASVSIQLKKNSTFNASHSEIKLDEKMKKVNMPPRKTPLLKKKVSTGKRASIKTQNKNELRHSNNNTVQNQVLHQKNMESKTDQGQIDICTPQPPNNTYQNTIHNKSNENIISEDSLEKVCLLNEDPTKGNEKNVSAVHSNDYLERGRSHNFLSYGKLVENNNIIDNQTIKLDQTNETPSDNDSIEIKSNNKIIEANSNPQGCDTNEKQILKQHIQINMSPTKTHMQPKEGNSTNIDIKRQKYSPNISSSLEKQKNHELNINLELAYESDLDSSTTTPVSYLNPNKIGERWSVKNEKKQKGTHIPKKREQSNKSDKKCMSLKEDIKSRAQDLIKTFEILDSDDSQDNQSKSTNISSTKQIFSESAIDDEELFVISDEEGGAIIVNETELYGNKSSGRWLCSECLEQQSEDDSDQIDQVYSDDSNEEMGALTQSESDNISEEGEEFVLKKEDEDFRLLPTEFIVKKYMFSFTVLLKQKKYDLILKKLSSTYNSLMLERSDYDVCNITPYDTKVSEKYKTRIRINASFIKAEHRTYIAASHPTKPYFKDFNEMARASSDLIVCLCCENDDYFVPDQKDGLIEENDIFKIEKNGSVTRLKFLKWEDFSTPHINDFLSFYEKYREFVTDRPVIVHCKAGVGRTGTFILFDILKRKDVITAKILLEELFKLRSERNHLVYNGEQLKWIISQFNVK